MASKVKKEMKKEYELYKGIEEFINFLKEKDMMKEPVVEEQINRILQDKNKLETFIKENVELSDNELEKKWAERETVSKKAMTPDERQKMKEFFMGMDEKTVRTESFKKLYELYLKDSVAKNSPGMEEWMQKKKELEGKLLDIINKNPSINVLGINTAVANTNNKIQNLKNKLDNLPEKKEVDRLEQSVLEKRRNLSDMIPNKRFSDDFESMRKLIADKKDMLVTVKNSLTNSVAKLNDYARNIKEDSAFRKEYSEKTAEKKRIEKTLNLKKAKGGKAEEIKVLEDSIKELGNWLTDNEKKVPAESTIQKHKDGRKLILEQSRKNLESLFSGYGRGVGVLEGIFQVINASAVLSGDKIMEELDKFGKRLDNELVKINEVEKEYNSLQEQKENLKKCPEVTQLREEENKLEYLESVKLEVDSIKTEKDNLKNIMDKENLEADAKHDAAVLLEYKDMLKGNHKNSKEYNSMIAALTIVQDWGTDNAMENVNKLPQKDRPQDFKQALDYLKKQAENYLKEKNRQIRPNPTGLRRERFAYAESIVSFAENRSKEMAELALQKEQTVEKVQTNVKEVNKDVQEPAIHV